LHSFWFLSFFQRLFSGIYHYEARKRHQAMNLTANPKQGRFNLPKLERSIRLYKKS